MNKTVSENTYEEKPSNADNSRGFITGASLTLFDFWNESLFGILWRRRWIILLTLLCVLGAVTLYLLQATAIYSSTARLYVEKSGPRIITEQEGVMTQSKNYLYTQKELLKSRDILSTVVKNKDISDLKTFRDEKNPVAYLKKNLDITVGTKDDIINITLKSPYREESARLVNAVVDSYITYNTTQTRTTAAEILNILQKEKVKRDKELSEKFQALMEFTKVNGAVSLENNDNNIVFHRLARLSEAYTEAQLEVLKAKADYDTATVMMNDPDKIRQLVDMHRLRGDAFIKSVEPAPLYDELARLQNELKTSQKHGTSNHPAVKALMLQIAQLQRNIAEQEQTFIQAYRNMLIQRWVTSRQKESEIAANLEEQHQKAMELNARASEYAVLQADLKRTEKLCDILDTRIKEIDVTEDTGALNISIVEIAQGSDKPVEPDKARLMGIALFLGLFMGLVFALICDRMDNRFRSVEEVSSVLNTPVLGLVPSITDKDMLLARGERIFIKPACPIAEAFRSIRTAVYFGAPRDQAHTILITSSVEGEGKSGITSNLAAAMARAGQRILVVDGDLRKPTQHRLFKLDVKEDLISVLTARASVEDVIQPTRIEGLDVLPCLGKTAQPSELLSSSNFMNLIQKLGQGYDRILIDSSPLMQVADARILGAICDMTVLVIRSEKTSRRSAEKAAESLWSVGAQLLGVVINDVSRKKLRYGYYQKYPYQNRHPDRTFSDRDTLSRKSETSQVLKTHSQNINPYQDLHQAQRDSLNMKSTTGKYFSTGQSKGEKDQ
ncbi:MAG: polysaccharide biosynthesis tyrosine autokinase [Sedimentisphaerales bacterium]|nr:polysaccharide biosynthesis tyrosine autokinase [Sedimentisphaerales bacterium]